MKTVEKVKRRFDSKVTCMELQDYYYRAYVEMVDTIKDTKEYAEFKDALRTADKGEDTHTGTVSHREIDLDWVEAIEETLIYIDRAIREQRRFIEQTEEVVPIEKAHRITVESVRHLAQHTNLIARVEDDTVTPEQILTIYREESFAIYENRFIRTLLDNAIRFVEIRYQALRSVNEVFFSQLEMNREVKFRQEWMNYEFKFGSKYEERASFDINADVSTLSNFERIVRIRRILMDFRSTPLMREVEKTEVVRPPIIRTNLMTKNVNYRKALDLWTFIETYNKDGYRFIAAEADGVMSKDMKEGLYNMFDMTSSVVRFNLNPVLKSRLQENYERENRRRQEEAEEAERKRKQEEQARLEAAVDAEKAKWEAYVDELNHKHEAYIEELNRKHDGEIAELEKKHEEEIAYERAERERQVAYEKAERERQVAYERQERAKEVAAVAAAAAEKLETEKRQHAADVEAERVKGEQAVAEAQRVAAEELAAERIAGEKAIAEQKRIAAAELDEARAEAETKLQAEIEKGQQTVANLQKEHRDALTQVRYANEIALAAADEKHKKQLDEQTERYERRIADDKKAYTDAQEKLQRQYGEEIRSLTEARDTIKKRAEADLAAQRDTYEKRIADKGQEHSAELQKLAARGARQIDILNADHEKELAKLEKRLQSEVGRNDREIKRAEQSFERKFASAASAHDKALAQAKSAAAKRLAQSEREFDSKLNTQKRAYEHELTLLRRSGEKQARQLQHRINVLQRKVNRLPVDDIEEAEE